MFTGRRTFLSDENLSHVGRHGRNYLRRLRMQSGTVLFQGSIYGYADDGMPMGRACGTGSGQRINRLFFSGVQQNVIRIYQAVYGGCMAKLNRAFVYRLYPDAEQAGLIQKTFGCCRFVYNYFLNARIKAYTEENRSVSFSQQSAALPALKKEFPWLAICVKLRDCI